ncbi:DUF4224 domain-containing protein [Endozoicomonas sp. Mp262]|uniref:DUF4224 domain-containing protein n=1 Tax=Endozoicomonas sp. Mp262 TaxID=2919499 RepID=UPI0021DA11DC
MQAAEQMLTEEQIIELTGATLKSKQRQILRSHGIFFVERLDGTVRTTWHHVNHPANKPLGNETDTPNFAAME